VSGGFGRLDVDDKIALAHVTANKTVLIVYQGRAISSSPRWLESRRRLVEQNIYRAQIPHRSLSVDVELTQRFNLVAKKFQPEGQWRLPRIEIDNPAANGELSPGGGLGDPLITARYELLKKAFHLDACSTPKLCKRGLKRATSWRSLIETRARCDDDVPTDSALDLHKHCQPFSRYFGVGQNILYSRKLGFRQEKRIWQPVEQTFKKQFLRMNSGAEDPNHGIGSVRIIN